MTHLHNGSSRTQSRQQFVGRIARSTGAWLVAIGCVSALASFASPAFAGGCGGMDRGEPDREPGDTVPEDRTPEYRGPVMCEPVSPQEGTGTAAPPPPDAPQVASDAMPSTAEDSDRESGSTAALWHARHARNVWASTVARCRSGVRDALVDRADPRLVRAFDLACDAARDGDARRARDQIRQATGDAGGDDNARLARGTVALLSGDAASALLEFERVQAGANEVLPLCLRSCALTGLGLRERAAERVASAIEASPDDAFATSLEALRLAFAGSAPESLAMARDGVKHGHRDPFSHLSLGVAALVASDADLAERAFERAQALGGDQPGYARAAALHYETRGRFRAAVECFERVTRISDNAPDDMFDLAIAQWRRGKKERAADVLRRLTRRQPERLDAWLNLGVLYHRHIRDRAGARAAYSRFLALGGKDARVPKWLAELR